MRIQVDVNTTNELEQYMSTYKAVDTLRAISEHGKWNELEALVSREFNCPVDIDELETFLLDDEYIFERCGIK